MTDPTATLELVRMHWSVLRGAQIDMLNGRQDLDALEEVAIASHAIDELLNTERNESEEPWQLSTHPDLG